MSTNPTVGQLALLATSMINDLTEEQAKCFIRKNKIRSNGKLKTLVNAQLLNKSLDEIAFVCAPSLKNETVAEEASNHLINLQEVDMENTTNTEETKVEEVKAAETAEEVKAVEVVEENNKETKVEAKKRDIVPVTPGPRGFRFGPVWNESIKAGKGVALMEINRNKLIAHAVSLNVDESIINEGNPDAIAKAISDVIASTDNTKQD